MSHALNLYRPVLDAVLLKDAGSLSRRPGMYVLRVAYVGLLAAVVYAFDRSLASEGGLVSPSEHAALGRDLFNGLAALQMVFLSIAASAIAADLYSMSPQAMIWHVNDLSFAWFPGYVMIYGSLVLALLVATIWSLRRWACRS